MQSNDDAPEIWKSVNSLKDALVKQFPQQRTYVCGDRLHCGRDDCPRCRIRSANNTANRIEAIVLRMCEDLGKGVLPSIGATTTNRSGATSSSTWTMQMPSGGGIPRAVRALHVLMVAHDYATTARNKLRLATKREIFYRDQKIYENSQANCDRAIDHVTLATQLPRRALRITASGKGVFSGMLCVDCGGEEKQDPMQANWQEKAVPNVTDALKLSSSSAKAIVVVEKHTMFSAMRQCFGGASGSLKQWADGLVLVTSKGYPDQMTVHFLQQMWKQLRLPIFILTDADPHGMEIANIYINGPARSAHYDSASLKLPMAKWIGMFPSDIDALSVESGQSKPIALTPADVKKIASLRAASGNELLQEELTIMEEGGSKVELDQLNILVGGDYLASNYLPSKLFRGKWKP